MDRYSTHLPILLACIVRTNGPVLELGCGDYSTLVLHYICHNRQLVSVESDVFWIEKFMKYKTKNHLFYSSLEEVPKIHWSVAFVDSISVHTRAVELEILKDCTDYIVLHDSDNIKANYEPILNKFKFRYTWAEMIPNTTVVSQTLSLEWIKL